jgi:hypothetical protein
MPLAIAITLGSLRLLGGLLKLQVGYKVGGMIIVMGWLVHEGSLASWLPLRLFWTAFGVLLTLLSLRLSWPARTLDRILNAYATLFSQLQLALQQLAEVLESEVGGHSHGEPPIHPTLYYTLLQELGTLPDRHPAIPLLACLDGTASRLVTLVKAMEQAAPAPQPLLQLNRLHRAEADLLVAMAGQLQHWEQVIRRHSLSQRDGQSLPKPPVQGLQLPESWQLVNQELSDPDVSEYGRQRRLERIAVRLLLCRQAEQAIRDGEANWMAILSRA